MASIKAYTLDEVADMLKVTKRTLYNHIKSGKLQAKKLGKYYRVTEESLQRLLNEEAPATGYTVTGQLQLNSRDRYEVNGVELTSGDALEVLVVDGTDNSPKWIETTVEHDGESYYLKGLLGYTLTGLFARVKP